MYYLLVEFFYPWELGPQLLTFRGFVMTRDSEKALEMWDSGLVFLSPITLHFEVFI